MIYTYLFDRCKDGSVADSESELMSESDKKGSLKNDGANKDG